MSWLEQHELSEGYASDAEVARLRGEYEQAQELYAVAARHEEKALREVAPDKPRTYGITAVSAVALRFKAAEFSEAKALSYRCLASERLPEFASRQIEDMLQSIKGEQAGIPVNDGQMLVSLKGGEILYGGAPMDLIIEKYQKMRSMIYRTAEYLKKVPHRRRGGPSKEIREAYRPWTFQAAPGSYQFAVSVQENRQLKLDLFDTEDLHPKRIVEELSHILQACSEAPDEGLLKVVPEDDYRLSFLKLARDLTPTVKGIGFTRLGIQTSTAPRPLVLTLDTRYALNEVIHAASQPSPEEQEDEIRGILRALHLDDDWLQVTQEDGKNITVRRAGEEIDDRIGPMVNHSVIVRVARSGSSLRFLDIELDE